MENEKNMKSLLKNLVEHSEAEYKNALKGGNDPELAKLRNLKEAAKVFPQEEAMIEREKYTHGYTRMVLLGIAELLDVELTDDERPIAENVAENWQDHWGHDVL